MMKFKFWIVGMILIICGVVGSWAWRDWSQIEFDTDWGRDLKEISVIESGKLVWLGPWLQANYPASSSYYYFFWPAVSSSNGHPYAMIWVNLGLVAGSLMIAGWSLRKFAGYKWSLVGVALIGLSPWMGEVVMHPGNGYSFGLFVLAGLSLVFARKWIVVASICMGIASSWHLSAFVAMPLLIKFWWEKRRQWKRVVMAMGGFSISWWPTLAYEYVTRGYLVRSLINKGLGSVMVFGGGKSTLLTMAEGMGMPWWMLVVVMIVLIWIVINKKVMRWETLVWFGGWGCLMLMKSGPLRYLYVSAILGQLLLLRTLAKAKLGKYICLVWLVLIVVASWQYEDKLPYRTIEAVMGNVEVFEEQFDYLKTKKIAVVAALATGTSVPQADDYRALLRFRGYEVVEITENQKADNLVMFVEDANFNYLNWQNWEIATFGKKKFEKMYRTPQVTIAAYGR